MSNRPGHCQKSPTATDDKKVVVVFPASRVKTGLGMRFGVGMG